MTNITYDLVSMAAIIRDFDQPVYINDEHEKLVDIADSIYNTGISPEDMIDTYRDLYYKYGESFWDEVLEDMIAIDGQLTSSERENDLLLDYNDRLGIL